jgi:hypothetical protein
MNTTTAGEEFTTTSNISIATSPVRTGTYSLRSNNTGAAESAVAGFVNANGSDGYFFRAYVYLVAAPTDQQKIIQVRSLDDTQRVSIRLNADRTLELWNEEDSAPNGERFLCFVTRHLVQN